jgi:hypothetical protein
MPHPKKARLSWILVLVLDFFGGFACRKALGVARVRHELCDGESNALEAFLECEALLAATFKVRGRMKSSRKNKILKGSSPKE